MKDLFNKTSTTSILAVMLVAFSFFLLGFMAIKYGGDATTRTQIITGVISSITGVMGYYFGASKRSSPTVAAENVENVNTDGK